MSTHLVLEICITTLSAEPVRRSTVVGRCGLRELGDAARYHHARAGTSISIENVGDPHPALTS
jgi:hypothetical protein